MSQTKLDSMTPTKALQEVLAWSAKLPDWQRNGLRILASGPLTNQDIADTIELCRLEHGLESGEGTFLTAPSEPHPTSAPLSREHLPTSADSDDPVTLVKLSGVTSVNALAPGQELPFAGSGITVIYGDNACGKSGYGRILKKVCRAREKEGPLLPNLLNSTPPERMTPGATVEYRVGEQEPREFSWSDGGPTAPELPFIQFFDSGCARVQVRENNEVPFSPLALELLQRLGGLCGLVKEQLLAERAHVESRSLKSIKRAIGELPQPQPDLPVLAADTKAHRFLSELGAVSSLVEAKALAHLGGSEKERLKYLRDALSENPRDAIEKRRARALRVEEAAQHVARVSELCSDDHLAKVARLASQARAAKAAADLASKELFGKQPLGSVTPETWHALWGAARALSSEVYPERPFPNTEDGARCVLCQQTLKGDAPQRLADFEEFVKGAAKAAAKEAEDALEEAYGPLRDLGFSVFGDAPSGLAEEDEELVASVRRFSRVGFLRRMRLARALGHDGEEPKHPEFPTDTEGALEAARSALQIEVDELERAEAAGSDERQALLRERDELQARELMGPLIPDIDEELKVLNALASLDDAVRSTDTKGISRKVTSLTKSVITSRVRAQFATELQELGGKFTPIELNQTGTSQGAPRFRAQLLAQPGTEVERVLSEGEHTCVALASFLTELSIAGHRSALIFDDPVSSLDHNWRAKVAERLVLEGARRQVIVFTHDAVFLMNLMEAAKRSSVELSCHHLTRSRRSTGIVMKDAPWVAMPVSKRLGVLRARLQDAKAVFNTHDLESYAASATTIYDLLRKTWERAIEEVLLNGAVMRFQRGVETKRVKALTDIQEDDYERIERAMTKCSECVHDEAAAINSMMPEPDEVAADIKDLSDWVDELRARRKKNR